MPRTAHAVTLQQEQSTISLHDAADRFARATMILMQIAKRTGHGNAPNYTQTPEVTGKAIVGEPHSSSRQDSSSRQVLN